MGYLYSRSPFLSLLCLILQVNLYALGEDPGRPGSYKEKVKTGSGQEISVEFVAIPGGEFLMGSPEDELGRSEDEGPLHRVQLSPFYLSRTEVTLELFLVYYHETVSERDEFDFLGAGDLDVDAVSGPTPVYGDMTMGHGPKNPAMGMTWQNAVNFCRWLSEKTGKEYRLPSEAEWEYAARCGNQSIYGFGDDANLLDLYAWYAENSSGDPKAVGTKQANAWGLFDMLGNVREWVSDFYSPDTYSASAKADPIVNPQGPRTGKVHVARGGHFRSRPGQVRCASRAFETRAWRAGDPQIPKSSWWLPSMEEVGFRIARSFDEE